MSGGNNDPRWNGTMSFEEFKASDKPEDKHWIQTFTGRRFYPLNPRVDDVALADIAHALALVCRFTGHVRRFYSVAEHSVRVSVLVERLAREGYLERGDAVDLDYVKIVARWGLLHDGSEAYLCDIAAPVKRSDQFATYRAAEATLQGVICSAFGLGNLMPGEVHRADMIMCATEAVELMNPRPDWRLPGVPLPTPQGLGWDPTFAEGQFLARFRALMTEEQAR